MKSNKKENKMIDDLSGKDLQELETFRGALQKAHDQYGDVCCAGVDPLGGREEAVKAEYGERIAAVNAEIAKRKQELSKYRLRQLELAHELLGRYHSAIDNIFYKNYSPAQLKSELDEIEEARRTIAALRDEMENEK